MQPPDQLTAAKLGTVKTELLVAFVFAVLAVLGWLLTCVTFLILLATPAGAFAWVGLVFVVPLALSALSLLRISKLRGAADRGDIAALKQLNSIGWAILALLVSGVVSGVLLLVAHGPISEVQSPAQAQ